MTPEIKAAITALVDVVLGERVDRHLLEPTLRCQLTVAVRDFMRFQPEEFAADRVKDHAILKRYFPPKTKVTA